MKKIFDELIEKKAQESLKRENEQNIRKARLAELQEKNKGEVSGITAEHHDTADSTKLFGFQREKPENERSKGSDGSVDDKCAPERDWCDGRG